MRNFEKNLIDLGYNQLSIENENIKPIYIPDIHENDFPDDGDNILEVNNYLEEVRNCFNNLKCTTNQSISNFIKYIDNLNKAIDGKMNFETQGIIIDLKYEYNICYETWYNKKNELLNLKLSDIDDSEETFAHYINKQNLDFSFNRRRQAFGPRPEDE